MAQTADVRAWEQAEILRSRGEAGQTPHAALRVDAANLRRYLAPPASTAFPLEYAFHLLGDIDGLTVLDYGCGNGENTLPLVRRGARAVGVDVSEALLRLARARLTMHGLDNGARLIAASAHDIPMPDGSVDVVLGIAILHHLELDRSASEIWRVLKPGGRAIFKEPVRNSRALRTIRGLIPYRSEDVSDYERPLTGADIARFAQRFRRGRQRVFSLPFINLAQVVGPLRRRIMPLYRLDAAILRRLPRLEHYAGIHVFELIKPERGRW